MVDGDLFPSKKDADAVYAYTPPDDSARLVSQSRTVRCAEWTYLDTIANRKIGLHGGQSFSKLKQFRRVATRFETDRTKLPRRRHSRRHHLMDAIRVHIT